MTDIHVFPLPQVPIAEWIATEVQAGLRVGADPKTMANSQWENLTKMLNEKSIYLIHIQKNLVDLIWYSRPNYTVHEATPLIYENSGRSNIISSLFF